jgi:uncharacterized protein (UPF0276 family)
VNSPSFAGFGIGLRPSHYQDIVDTHPAIDWFEIISEDFMIEGGSPLYYLDQIRAQYPLAMHGVSLSIGSCDPLDQDYLQKLKLLADRVEPMWISDHLCWTGVNGVNMHDLMPLPYTQESVDHVAQRVQQVQDYLQQQILLENVSSYVDYRQSEMTEWEFLAAVAEKADCLILLDINNVFVNSFNHQFNAIDYLNHLPAKRIKQFHLAGHENCETHIVDTHNHPIINNVWELYEEAVKRYGAVATLIERDANIPSIPELMTELDQAKTIYHQTTKARVCYG